MLTVVSNTKELADYRARMRWFVAVGLIGMTVLVGRVAYLQILHGEDYSLVSRDNFQRVVDLAPDRGLIRDVRGRTIASNRPSYTVFLTPHFARANGGAVFDRLADYVGLNEEEVERLRAKVEAAKGLRRFEPVLVRRDAQRDSLAMIETHRRELPGVTIEASSHRVNPGGRLAAHVLGYMNEISAEELERATPEDYQSGEYIGRVGLERAFERELRGTPGLERVVVDALGMRRDLWGIEAADDNDRMSAMLSAFTDVERRVEAIPGKNLVLSIDMKLQRIMKNALHGHASGAVVAIDPNSGRVLGMQSKPTFNPTSWTGRLSAEEKAEIDENLYTPMINKALWSYFPGSVYKIVTALAALEQGVVDLDETVDCHGYHTFGKRVFRCWNRSGHGEMNLQDALKHSCDVFFYVVGERLGMDTLARYGRELGFGSPTGIAMNGESPGLVPTRAWHNEHSGEGFQHGFTLNTAVGQGDTRATPLQVGMAFAAVANGGTLYKPTTVDRIETAEGQPLVEMAPKMRHRLRFRPEHIEAVHQSLDMAVNAEGGTAFEGRLNDIRVAGKTGTAQVRGLGRRVSGVDEALRYRLRDHAWFVGYAPADNPEVVVVVFLEHGGSGGKKAVPVAMKVIDGYFREVLGEIPGLRTAALAAPKMRGRRRPVAPAVLAQ